MGCSIQILTELAKHRSTLVPEFIRRITPTDLCLPRSNATMSNASRSGSQAIGQRILGRFLVGFLTQQRELFMQQRVAIRPDHAVAEKPPGRLFFTDATCDRLTQLILALAAVDRTQEAPAYLKAMYCTAIDADEALRLWDQQSGHGVQEADSKAISGSPAIVDSSEVNCPVIQLPQRLIRFASWGEHLIAADDASCAAHRLRNTAAIVVRLATLEDSFAKELASQKQQAIYNFAYGLSHELNNPLANIATRAGVLANDETDARRANLLNVIIDSAMRGSEMLGDLMLVARPPALNLKATNVAEFLDAIASKAQPWAVQHGVTIELRHDDVENIELDTTAMREAIWALMRNGLQSMQQGGRLIVDSSQAVIQGRKTWLIEISDEGPGLSARALENCFDPYFSGREAGRGLGLGLSKAQRLVGLHGGVLTLRNRPGVGCTARIELPS